MMRHEIVLVGWWSSKQESWWGCARCHQRWETREEAIEDGQAAGCRNRIIAGQNQRALGNEET